MSQFIRNIHKSAFLLIKHTIVPAKKTVYHGMDVIVLWSAKTKKHLCGHYHRVSICLSTTHRNYVLSKFSSRRAKTNDWFQIRAIATWYMVVLIYIIYKISVNCHSFQCSFTMPAAISAICVVFDFIQAINTDEWSGFSCWEGLYATVALETLVLFYILCRKMYL